MQKVKSELDEKDELSISKNKVVSFSLIDNYVGGGRLISTDIDDILNEAKIQMLETELKTDDEVVEFTIRIEKKYSKTEIDELPEFTGF